MFFKGSRYETIPEGQIADISGRKINYKRTRFTPETPAITQHRVAQNDRLDLMAYQYYRDPELFWRICDANKAMLPDQLVAEVGQRILIPPALR
jgi:nucleoid-associated protein YgaU